MAATSGAEFLAVALPDDFTAAIRTRLGGATVVTASSISEARDALRGGTFEMILISDLVAKADDPDALAEIKKSCGSRPCRIAYFTDPPTAPNLGDGLRRDVDVERIFFRPIDLEEVLGQLARSAGVELLPPAPDSATKPDAAAQLSAIWERFRGATLARIDVIENATLSLLDGKLQAAEREEATREAHKLAGSAGTFGFPAASRIAREIEQAYTRPNLVPSDARTLSEQLVLLREELEGTPHSPAAAAPSPARTGRNRVLIFDAAKDSRERLVMEAEGRGLTAVEIFSVAEARSSLSKSRPDAAVLAFGEVADYPGILALLDELQLTEPPVPTVVIAPRGGLEGRVEIAQRGASRRLEHPAPPSSAIDAVLAVIGSARERENTVLAVDDDPRIIATLEAMLTPRGIRVVGLTDPLLFWKMLDEVAPDLVILDIDMPHVSGIELCRALKNDDRWMTIPVVFFTSRSDAASVQRVFAAGADDHLGKPISEAELVMRVENRLERVRQLREQADTDSLTRLPARRKSLELMRRFVLLARRTDAPLSIAFVDVDRLKTINSDYGHSAGDSVLRALGRLLLQSLGGEDLVGRWGGDEFVVAFFGLGKREAALRMEGILESFAATVFQSEDGREFSCSFNAGIAQLAEDGKTAQELVAVAEEASGDLKYEAAKRVRCVGDAISGGSDFADIALIEDDEALAGLLRHGFDTAGLKVRWFGDGQAGVAALGGENPSLRVRLIILDVDLPGLNGYDVLRRLSREGILRTTKVLMLTARNAESDVLAGLGLGALDHVSKPFSLPVLMRKVSSALQSGGG